MRQIYVHHKLLSNIFSRKETEVNLIIHEFKLRIWYLD